jgi:Fe-S-cluster-containing hydrogenase component 2
MEFFRNPQACYGCRACELICSFHHQGSFLLGGGSIEVSKDHRTGEIRWSVNSTCDSCKNEDLPLCVRYCAYDALTISRRE